MSSDMQNQSDTVVKIRGMGLSCNTMQWCIQPVIVFPSHIRNILLLIKELHIVLDVQPRHSPKTLSVDMEQADVVAAPTKW